MPGKVTISLKGWGDLEQALKTIGPKAARKAGGKAMLEAAEPIVEQAKVYVPVRTGALQDSITSQAVRTNVNEEITRHIGFRMPVGARAHFVEFGTSKMRAQPFMRPALDIKAQDAIAIMGEAMWEGIAAEAEAAPKGNR
jgi:HK97 gp10 family phage protein